MVSCLLKGGQHQHTLLHLGQAKPGYTQYFTLCQQRLSEGIVRSHSQNFHSKATGNIPTTETPKAAKQLFKESSQPLSFFLWIYLNAHAQMQSVNTFSHIKQCIFLYLINPRFALPDSI